MAPIAHTRQQVDQGPEAPGRGQRWLGDLPARAPKAGGGGLAPGRDNGLMRAQQAPPAGYGEAGRIILSGNRRLVVAVNVASVLVLIASCLVLGPLASAVRPDVLGYEISFDLTWPTLVGPVAFAAGLALTPVAVIVLHEMLHGVGFWSFTRARPRFGFKTWYAYATAPGWFFSRAQMLVIGLAPFAVITLAGLLVAWQGPKALAVLALFGIAINTAGTVGDAYLALRILRLPKSAVIEDQVEGMIWYLPIAQKG